MCDENHHINPLLCRENERINSRADVGVGRTRSWRKRIGPNTCATLSTLDFGGNRGNCLNLSLHLAFVKLNALNWSIFYSSPFLHPTGHFRHIWFFLVIFLVFILFFSFFHPFSFRFVAFQFQGEDNKVRLDEASKRAGELLRK